MTTIERRHEILFGPKDIAEFAGIVLSLPDCAMVCHLPGASGEIEELTNIPFRAEEGAEYWIRYACEIAGDELAWVCFNCSTPEYAEMAATLASSLLPNHERAFPKQSVNRPPEARLQ